MREQEPGARTSGPVDLEVSRLKDSMDRSLMTWTSMAVSMIGFGFAIYEVLRDRRVQGAVLPGANTPRNVGMYLVAAGTVGIVMGTVSYVRTLRRLRDRYSLVQPALIVALMICALGLFLCFTIATRLF